MQSESRRGPPSGAAIRRPPAQSQRPTGRILTAHLLFRGETESAISTVVLFVLVTLVAYLRWKIAPIAARNRA